MKFVKIYSERNSGSIYLEWLLRKNLDIVISDTFDLGWKHRLAPSSDELSEKLKEEVIYICLVKNPYSWLLSMHKRPYLHESLKSLSFADFVRFSYGDYRNPITMWNTKNNSYLGMEDYIRNFKLVRYEDLLVDSENEIIAIADKFGLKMSGTFRNINRIITNSHGVKKSRFHKDYYVDEIWKKKLRDIHIERINQFLDEKLMQKLNYSIITQ